jgi:hypothetical protein
MLHGRNVNLRCQQIGGGADRLAPLDTRFNNALVSMRNATRMEISRIRRGRVQMQVSPGLGTFA